MSSYLLILPHHLFALIPKTLQAFQAYDHIVCIEEPIFFYDAVYRPLKVHKLRLAHMRASLKAYHHHINANIHHRKPTQYIDWARANTFLKQLPRNAIIYIEDPIDHDITSQ
jgi:deoxyribodipyrimidine photolyase-like uncharacterized protein